MYDRALQAVVKAALEPEWEAVFEPNSYIQRCREIISEWLSGIGLELKPEKTRLTHTLHPEFSEDGKAGFDFLGHHIRQYPAGKYRSNISAEGRILVNSALSPNIPLFCHSPS